MHPTVTPPLPPAAVAGGAFLGNRGESIHGPGAKKGEARELTADETARLVGRKRERFELLRTAQSILYDRDQPASGQHATCWCHRATRTQYGDTFVYRTTNGTGARLSGITTCGLPWTCPVCAAKIAEARRRELEAAMRHHVEAGGAAYLITTTFPHEAGDDLPDLLKRQAKALQSFKNSRTYKRILGKGGTAGRIGSVRSLEVTQGVNGWHPHTHDLHFAKRRAFDEGAADPAGRLSSSAIDELRSAWCTALDKAGLLPHEKTTWAMLHALDVRGGEHAADYIAKYGRDEKWGMSREATAHVRKIGRVTVQGDKHRTPFQILADARQGDASSWRLFREYADAFKGKRQLTWSPGLKTSLGVRDVSDEDIAADDAKKPDEACIGQLTAPQLAVITSRAALGEFLECVALYVTNPHTAQADIDDYVEIFRTRPPTNAGTLRVRREASDYVEGGTWTH